MNPTIIPTMPPRPTPTKPAGWIYLLHTPYDPHKYVGQSKRPVWKRVGEERKTFPWGADILPGRDGYTILRRVPSSGDPVVDEILLDLAEAEEIQKWEPSENAHRPDPRVFRDRLAAVQAGLPAGLPRYPSARPTVARPQAARGGRGVAPRGPRPVPWRAIGFVLLSAAWVLITLRVSFAMPNPTAPWVVIPMAAVLGPAFTVGVFRRTTRKRRRRSGRRR